MVMQLLPEQIIQMQTLLASLQVMLISYATTTIPTIPLSILTTTPLYLLYFNSRHLISLLILLLVRVFLIDNLL